MDDQPGPRPDEITADLRRAVRHGLPLRVPATPTALTRLEQVRARAARDDPASLTAAADALIRTIVLSYGTGPDGTALQALFGMTPGTRALTLTARRELAAQRVDRSVDHWRKHLEPAHLRAIAQELWAREQLYQPRDREVAPTGPFIAPEDPDDDSLAALERYEIQARVAAAMHEYRADLVHVFRLNQTNPDSTPQAGTEKDSAIWRCLYSFTRLLYQLNVYMRIKGESILLNGRPVGITSIIQVAGWHPPFTRQQRDYLVATLARAGDNGPQAFIDTLTEEPLATQITDTWREHLTTSGPLK